ncbi:hypothetical protein AYI69_g1995 [Smittium culicis]|uniref:Autophagy-related protein 17 n=1 Tax=Smittium culicis TaxID=133412 RepID=A0A1R1YP58_9FUNG|nr:hypothetical protein AYI69_g1995 [Smittium culicis]
MLSKLYSLKEPAYNGLEIAKKYHKQIISLKDDLAHNFDIVSKCHPVLSFLVQDNPVQLELAKNALNVADRMFFVQKDIINGALNDRKDVFTEMDNVLSLLKSLHIKQDVLINTDGAHNGTNNDILAPTETRKTLFDFIDDTSIDTLLSNASEVSNGFNEQLARLDIAKKKISIISAELLQCETSSILIKADDINVLRGKVDFCDESVEQFFEDYESLIHHCTQLDQVITYSIYFLYSFPLTTPFFY